jgi:hypothetical protein
MILNPSPGLSVVTAELSAVVRQRRAVIQMKKYLRLCRLASSDRLLRYGTYQAAAQPGEKFWAYRYRSRIHRSLTAVIQMKKYLRLCRLASSDRLLRYLPCSRATSVGDP